MCFTVQKRAGCREEARRKEEKNSGDAFGRLTSMSSQSRDPEPYCSRHWCTALYRTPGSTEFQECLSFTGASSRHQPQPRLGGEGRGGGERERERGGGDNANDLKTKQNTHILCTDFLKVWTEQRTLKFPFTEERADFRGSAPQLPPQGFQSGFKSRLQPVSLSVQGQFSRDAPLTAGF